MKVVIQPGRLLGKIKIPPSKSFAHRALICGALSDGESIIYNCGNSEDISATKNCLSALGRIFEAKGGRRRRAKGSPDAFPDVFGHLEGFT